MTKFQYWLFTGACISVWVAIGAAIAAHGASITTVKIDKPFTYQFKTWWNGHYPGANQEENVRSLACWQLGTINPAFKKYEGCIVDAVGVSADACVYAIIDRSYKKIDDPSFVIVGQTPYSCKSIKAGIKEYLRRGYFTIKGKASPHKGLAA